MRRRTFISACAASCAAAAVSARAAAALQPRYYARSLLVGSDDQPLRPGSVAIERNYIFHYPYAATPCFLLNLRRPATPADGLKTAAAEQYHWPGGVGPQQTLVAYSAICAHKLSYPTRDISFISYRSRPTAQSKLAQVIHCCSEDSQYDAAQGARVLAGPAPQPLAAILLEFDPQRDALYAIGTLGGEMFNAFFARFSFRLALEHGARKAGLPAGERVQVVELDNYCRQQVRC